MSKPPTWSWGPNIKFEDDQSRPEYKPTKVRAAKAKRAKRCEECGVYPADFPSKICSGCEAYKDHYR